MFCPYHESESALYYYRARHYDPKVGRFLQQDPEPPRWEEMNAYVYVSNNPLNWIDPYGTAKGPEHKYGDYCVEAVRTALKRKQKPSRSWVHIQCTSCCVEAVESNPCGFALPEPALIACLCIGICEAGLSNR